MLTVEVAQGFRIEAGEEDQGYQLVGPGEAESGVTDYGDTARVEVDGKVYETTVENLESALTEEQELCLVLDEVPEVDEDVEFELEEEGDEEEDEAVES